MAKNIDVEYELTPNGTPVIRCPACNSLQYLPNHLGEDYEVDYHTGKITPIFVCMQHNKNYGINPQQKVCDYQGYIKLKS